MVKITHQPTQFQGSIFITPHSISSIKKKWWWW